jgi:hypothetical protein
LVNESPNQIIYDESLNPINLTDLKQNEYLNDDNKHYLQYQQIPQQQIIWLPREDVAVNESANIYNQNQHMSQILQPNLTLCNGKELPNDLKDLNPAFTIRRHIVNAIEDQKQIETLKHIISARLKIQISSSVEDLGLLLSDGVILCHLINQIFPRAVQIIHVPTISMVLKFFLSQIYIKLNKLN